MNVESPLPNREDVREDDRVTDRPVGRVLRLTFHQAALDDPVLELIERDLRVVPRQIAIFTPLFSPTNS